MIGSFASIFSLQFLQQQYMRGTPASWHVGHLGEQRHPNLGLPLGKQILGGLTQG